MAAPPSNPTVLKSRALFKIQTAGRLSPHIEQEYLLTNGLGAFSASTVVGCNTRRYHSLLVAATQPPLGRISTVSRVGEILCLDGKTDHPLEFSINQFEGGNIHPRGDRYLQSFELGATAAWNYDVEGVQVAKELQLVWGENLAAVRYTLRPASPRRIRLELLPFVALRDFHALRRGTGAPFHASVSGPLMRVEAGDGVKQTVFIRASTGTFKSQPDWWRGHKYPVEAERGQDDTEDLFNPGRLIIEADSEFTVTLWIGIADPGERDFDAELAGQPDPTTPSARLAPPRGPRGARQPAGAEQDYRPTAVNELSPAMRRLFRAAADFVVRRNRPDGQPGTTILAGYPWFADWGRDTMISLPGLLLSTGRFAEARQVLTLFAHYVSEGMIPNRFDDYTNEASYNTVDASLWFIHACHEYRDASNDNQTFEQDLLPACREVLRGYRQGTRFGIRMDEADGLITQGDATTQLTWMDAKIGSTVFTPRSGKPVEINALWYNALRLMGENSLADQARDSFQKAFWLSPFRGLADVVTGPEAKAEGGGRKAEATGNSPQFYKRDVPIRPNQIFAVSLPHSPLAPAQQAAVVETVRRELLTPFGLRTLSRNDRNYNGRYTGNQWSRDRAYHNGTVWVWLIGAFVEAHLRINDFSPAAIEQARAWLSPVIDHMSDRGCIGQIAECFDGDEPHRPVGTPAQAWSVAEVLRAARMVGI